MGVRGSQHIRIVKSTRDGAELGPTMAPEVIFDNLLKIPFSQITRSYIFSGGHVSSEYLRHKESLDKLYQVMFRNNNQDYYRKFLSYTRVIDGKPKFSPYTKKGYEYERLTELLFSAGILRKQGKGYTLTDFGSWLYEHDSTTYGSLFPLGLFTQQTSAANLGDVVPWHCTCIKDYLGKRIYANFDLSDKNSSRGYSAMVIEDKRGETEEQRHKNNVEDSRNSFFRTPLFAKMKADLETVNTADLELTPVAYDPTFDMVTFVLRTPAGLEQSCSFPRRWYKYFYEKYDGDVKLLTFSSEVAKEESSDYRLNGRRAVMVSNYDNRVVGVFDGILHFGYSDYCVKKIHQNLNKWYSTTYGNLRDLL